MFASCLPIFFKESKSKQSKLKNHKTGNKKVGEKRSLRDVTNVTLVACADGKGPSKKHKTDDHNKKKKKNKTQQQAKLDPKATNNVDASLMDVSISHQDTEGEPVAHLEELDVKLERMYDIGDDEVVASQNNSIISAQVRPEGVQDIDAEDHQEPECCTVYVNDIIDYLFQREVPPKPSPKHHTAAHITLRRKRREEEKRDNGIGSWRRCAVGSVRPS